MIEPRSARPRALLAAVLLGLGAPALAQEPEDPPRDERPQVVHMGRAFLFRADLALSRAARWAPADLDDAALLEATRQALEERLRRAGRFVEAQVDLEQDGRFAVVFVGRQDPRMEAFIQDGVSRPGRVSCRIVARDADLPQGATLAGERERLERWAAAHPDRPLPFFHDVPRPDGGPLPELEWFLPWGDAGVADAVALLRAPVLDVTRRSAQRLTAGPSRRHERPGSLRIVFELREEAVEPLRAFRSGNAGRDLAVVLDDRLLEIGPMETESDEVLAVDAGLTEQEVRSVVFSVMGERLPVRLVFEEFSKRELRNVSMHGE